ncbi:RGCVC family protein [Cryptosporangium aurantiacum]|uniref:Uncharacterized protein n=1 Tax=Cryptosporangium aurantiacum TaxID=134849 RepID=A0A1M7RN73_9ACTN|nr:RGCVC family protein [Cryptosporangium aurantiacum]SHN47775.1 hypothetical protein SAMN05443668_1282 [Cryptosporangium aurantiacum]
MTSPTTVVDDRKTLSGKEETCDVCAHETAAHDPISRRYCAATLANALTRLCICT